MFIMKLRLCAYIPKGLQFHLDALQDLIHEQDARILQAALLLLHPLPYLLKGLKIDEIVIKDNPDESLTASATRFAGTRMERTASPANAETPTCQL